jgi:signal transduction histidine kinase
VPNKTERWIFIAGGLLALALAAGIAVDVSNVERLHTQTRWVAHTYEVMASLDKIVADLDNAESGQRGYLITGDARYLQPYDQAAAAIASDVAHLETLTGDNPSQRAPIAELRAHAHAKLAELADSIKARRDAGFDAAKAIVLTDRGRAEMDALRGVISRMAMHEEELLVQREQSAASAYRISIVAAFGGGAIALVLIVAYMFLLRRYLRERDRVARESSEADRRKDEFLATLAHELRNPLAPISNSLHLLEDGNVAPATHQRARETMRRQMSHLVRLVDDLLDAGRIRTGKLVLARQRCDLADAIQHGIEIATPSIEAAKHELVVSIPHPIQVDGDPARLAQVFSNLVGNAAKFTPRGGRIDVRAKRDGNEAVVRVRDNGVGIDRAHLDEIFTIFAQVGSHERGGLGIGLSLVRQLVEMHGGSVEAHSQGAGQGSEFVVRLPALPAD